MRCYNDFTLSKKCTGTWVFLGKVKQRKTIESYIAQKHLSIYSKLNEKAHLLNGIKILNKNIEVY